MYINFKYLISKGLNEFDLPTLQAVKQQKFEEDMEEIVARTLQDDRLAFYIKNGWVESIKGTKSMSDIAKLRLTKSGVKLLDEIETAEVEEQDIVLFSWLENFYSSEDKMIGNKKRSKTGIAQFRKHTGIERNALAFLLKEFISDEENMKYNNKLEKIFYSSDSLYSRKFNIDECRLNTFYEKRKEYFNQKFENMIN